MPGGSVALKSTNNNQCQRKLEDKKILRTRRTKKKLIKKQKQLLHRCFGIRGFIFNEALRLIEEEGQKPSFKPSNVYFQNKNRNNHKYVVFYDHNLCDSDAKAEEVGSLWDVTASTKKSSETKELNPNHFQTDRIYFSMKLCEVWKGRFQGNDCLEKRMDKLQSKIDKHYKAFSEFKKGSFQKYSILASGEEICKICSKNILKFARQERCTLIRQKVSSSIEWNCLNTQPLFQWFRPKIFSKYIQYGVKGQKIVWIREGVRFWIKNNLFRRMRHFFIKSNKSNKTAGLCAWIDTPIWSNLYLLNKDDSFSLLSPTGFKCEFFIVDLRTLCIHV